MRYYRFKPLNVGRIVIWSLFALALIVAPQLFTSSLALTMLSQIGYAIIICLSYNILLGQGGMLSFGHAVYTGLGSFLAVHAINMASDGRLPIPLVLMPLVILGMRQMARRDEMVFRLLGLRWQVLAKVRNRGLRGGDWSFSPLAGRAPGRRV